MYDWVISFIMRFCLTKKSWHGARRDMSVWQQTRTQKPVPHSSFAQFTVPDNQYDLDNRTLALGVLPWYSLAASLKSPDLSELQLSDESKRGLRDSWTHHFLGSRNHNNCQRERGSWAPSKVLEAHLFVFFLGKSQILPRHLPVTYIVLWDHVRQI